MTSNNEGKIKRMLNRNRKHIPARAKYSTRFFHRVLQLQAANVKRRQWGRWFYSRQPVAPPRHGRLSMDFQPKPHRLSTINYQPPNIAAYFISISRTSAAVSSANSFAFTLSESLPAP